MLGRLALHRILLRSIAHRRQILLAEQRVVFDVDLGVERQKIALAGHDQRIDLHQTRIAVQIQPIQRMCDLAELTELRSAQPQAESQLPALKVLQPRGRMNVDPNDLLRRVLGDLFDIHAARGRSNERNAARLPIQYQAKVNLARDL